MWPNRINDFKLFKAEVKQIWINHLSQFQNQTDAGQLIDSNEFLKSPTGNMFEMKM